jgi:hypothetical protein
MPQLAHPGPRAGRAYHWLAALPGVAMLAGVAFFGRARPLVLGLPFLLFWILVCVLATAAIMALIYRADEAADRARVAPGPQGDDVADPSVS